MLASDSTVTVLTTSYGISTCASCWSLVTVPPGTLLAAGYSVPALANDYRFSLLVTDYVSSCWKLIAVLPCIMLATCYTFVMLGAGESVALLITGC